MSGDDHFIRPDNDTLKIDQCLGAKCFEALERVDHTLSVYGHIDAESDLHKFIQDILFPGSPNSGGPFFLTQWEREDYEREQRGEKPLGPR